jgi:hypothetical protein
MKINYNPKTKLLFLVPIVTGLIAAIILITRPVFIFPQAAGNFVVENFAVTNLRTDSFTVVWTSPTITTACLLFDNQVFVDDRDRISGIQKPYFTHKITVSNLASFQSYSFTLGESSPCRQTDEYQTITLAASSGTDQTAWGTVVTQAGTPAQDILILLQTSDNTLFADVSTQSGTWAIAFPSSSRSQLQLSAYPGNPQIPVGLIPSFTLEQGGHAPDLILESQSSDGLSTPPTPAITMDDTTSGFDESLLQPLNDIPEIEEIDLQIDSISYDGEIVYTDTPEIQGTAEPLQTLTITIHSDQAITATITADSLGNWDFTPSESLSPGEHTITITDAQGNTVTRTFIVQSAGASLPSFESTPSATPTLSTPTPTPTIYYGRTSQPSTPSAVPVAGVLTPTLIIFIMSILSLISGGYLLVVQKNNS